MAKREPSANRRLTEYQQEWRQSRKKITLQRAIKFCKAKRLTEPRWLRDALCGLGRKQVTKVKSAGNKTDLGFDDQIYATVEDYISHGLTQEKAWERTGREYCLSFHGVKHAWRRHKERIVKVDPEKNQGQEWRFKKTYLKADKNAWMSKNIPPYLRTKN